MAEIKKQGEREIIDYMARDYDSILASMRALIPTKLPEWRNYTSESDFGNVLLQLFAHMGDQLNYYLDRVANESFLTTAATRRSIIQHLGLIGYRLSTAAPATASLRLTFPPDFEPPEEREAVVLEIRKGDAFGTASQKDRPSIRFEYVGDYPLKITVGRLKESSPDGAGTGGAKRYYFDGLPVEEGRLIKEEYLGTSDGTANQSFQLTFAGVILRSFDARNQSDPDLQIVAVDKSGGTGESYQMRQTFAFSRSAEPHFIVEIDEEERTEARFGDGIFGKIPPPGTLLYATYRVGGGVRGNVASDEIRMVLDAPAVSDASITVTNPDPATGGAERESIEHAILHAPGVFRAQGRAVTAEDFREHALNVPGVGKVRARASGWNRVVLSVAPCGGGQVSDRLRTAILTYFEDIRPVTTIVEVESVSYAEIVVALTVEANGSYRQEFLKDEVESAVRRLFDFNAIDFNRPVYLSKIYEAVESIAGVDSVTVMEFYRFKKGEEIVPYVETTGKIVLENNELVSLKRLNLTLLGGIPALGEAG